ncbi:MAG: insulinase family protein [Gemmatimonadetes bacterium]|nr:insulinase family protein [Gemmatimonadota bacterium]
MNPFHTRLIVLAAALAGVCSTAAAQDTTAARPRVAPPAPLPARPIQFPAYTETTLPNGLRLLVVENHRIPVANVELYVRSGTAADPMAKLGVASMTAELLDNGTTKRTAKQIAETIEGVGGSLNTGADRDNTVISSGVLADQLPLAFDLVSDVAMNPTFPADELETTRRQTLSGLQASLGQAGTIARRRLDMELYGPTSPYGVAATPATVQSITRADLEAFHHAHFGPRNALLVVSGDVTPARAEQLARQYFGSWTGTAAAAPVVGTPVARTGNQIYLVNRPGSVQSSIRIGEPGIRPDNPDYYAIQVLNMILGAGPSSRLEKIIRTQHAWTYSARSQFTRPLGTGVFIMDTEVRTPVTDSALAEALAQLRRIREEPVTRAELDAAKSFLAGSFPLRFETAGQTASQLATVRLLGLPVESLKVFTDRVSAVTVADVQRVARQYLHPDRVAIVVVGDASKIMTPLQRIAPVTLYDVQGNRIDPSALQARAATDRFDASRLQPATLTYGISFQGNNVGTATSTLAREGANWVSADRVQAGPTTQSVEVRFTGDLTPVSFKQSVSAGAMKMDIDLRYENGRVRGTAQMPAQMGGNKTIDTVAVAGTRFSGMEAWIIAVSDLDVGKTISVPIFDARAGSVVPGTFKVTGMEKVTVPAGTFDAYKVESQAGEQSSVLYVRKDGPHIVLRQQPSAQPVVIELQSIK